MNPLATVVGIGLAALVVLSLTRSSSEADDQPAASSSDKHRRPPIAASLPGSPETPGPTAAARAATPAAEAQRLLARYLAELRGRGQDARIVLDTIYAFGLAKTADNLRAIRATLASRVSDTEKIALLRILASFHTVDDSLQSNANIRADLRDLAYSGNAEIARAATLAYTRLGYQDDSLALLGHAKQEAHVGADDYYGELAYLLRAAPKEVQLRIARELSLAGNAFSMEILASLVQESSDLGRFSPEALEFVRPLLIKGEPPFPTPADDFGLVYAVRYSTWLNAAALLDARSDETRYAAFITGRLGAATVDPRKLVAFLIFFDTNRLAGLVADPEFAGTIDARITSFAQQYADNRVLQDAANEAISRLNALRR